MKRRKFLSTGSIAALSPLAALTACGGGGSAAGSTSQFQAAAQAMRAAARTGRPLAAQAIPAIIQARQLLDWAEANFPNFFGVHEAPGDIHYFMFLLRYYPQTNTNLGVVVDEGQGFPFLHVYVLGDITGNQLIDVGTVSSFLTPLPAWTGLGGDSQHTAVSAVQTQPLNRIAWQAAVDMAPLYSGNNLLAHYGSPVITPKDTVLIPVKTGSTSGFKVEARAGGSGSLMWSHNTDYIKPPLQPNMWFPSYNVALTPEGWLYVPGAGGKLMLNSRPDASGDFGEVYFFPEYSGNPAAFNATVFINTPLTSDPNGNIFFGFQVTGANPAELVGGVARIDATGNGTWISATAAANDVNMTKPAMNCAPAISPDGSTVYIAVNNVASKPYGYLLALDSTTLAVKNRVLLLDPNTGNLANVSDKSTSSPSIAPDGRVFYGVLENPFPTHNQRGWLLQFTPTLESAGAPGSFGWDVSPSVIPSSMVPDWVTSSPYLVAVKYNNYEGAGTGDGQNAVAILDPSQTQADFISPTVTVMKEVRKMIGPQHTDGDTGPVFEWCINTMAADPFDNTILVNSEDGVLYRWHLPTNTLTQSIRITNGIGEAYTPTAVGPDGTVYAMGNAILFAIKA